MRRFAGNDMNKSSYFTWYEFKKAIQKESRRSILNKEWLQSKPVEPLPWDDTFVQSTLLKLSKKTNTGGRQQW